MSVDNHITMLPKAATPVPKPAIAIMLVLAASVIAMVIYMGSKPASSQETTPGQELIIGVDRATLYVPKDAVILAGVISISSLESNLYSTAEDKSEWFRSQVVDIKYLDREGKPYDHVTFPKPVLICFMIRERWQDYTQHPDEYQVQYYAEDKNPPEWVSLPMSTNPDRYQLCGQTTHLSIFSLAVKPQAEIPITGGTPIPTPAHSISPAITPTQTPKKVPSPLSTRRDGGGGAPVVTQKALTETDVPPTDVPPTSEPPTVEPPTSEPPTSEPPTSEPPTEPPPPTDPPTKPPPPTDPPVEPPPPTNPPVEPPPPTSPPAG